MRTITVVPYEERWAAAFEAIRKELWKALGRIALSIEHVGSTSVPGLWAKPVIDIDAVIPAGGFPAAKRALEGAGYVHAGDLGIAGREAFDYEDKPHLMTHYLYVCEEGSAELRRHLCFRDYLRKHAGDRDRYSRIKQEMARKHPHDIDRYIEGKAPVVREIYAKIGC